jgi:hypothetical protein
MDETDKQDASAQERFEYFKGRITDPYAAPEEKRDRALEIIRLLLVSQERQAALLTETAKELREARDFFSAYVPLVDHNGQSLHQDWSWGPADDVLNRMSALTRSEAR